MPHPVVNRSSYLPRNYCCASPIQNVKIIQVMDNVTAYQILGVEPGTSPAEIKKTFHQLSLRYHPDKAGHESTAAYQDINLAYQVACDHPLDIEDVEFHNQKTTFAAAANGDNKKKRANNTKMQADVRNESDDERQDDFLFSKNAGKVFEESFAIRDEMEAFLQAWKCPMRYGEVIKKRLLHEQVLEPSAGPVVKIRIWRKPQGFLETQVKILNRPAKNAPKQQGAHNGEPPVPEPESKCQDKKKASAKPSRVRTRPIWATGDDSDAEDGQDEYEIGKNDNTDRPMDFFSTKKTIESRVKELDDCDSEAQIKKPTHKWAKEDARYAESLFDHAMNFDEFDFIEQAGQCEKFVVNW